MDKKIVFIAPEKYCMFEYFHNVENTSFEKLYKGIFVFL